MAEFKISRFRYTWQGDWQGGSATYNRDDIVLYEGRAWVCIRQHSATVFQQDQNYIPPGETLPSPAWVKMTDGYKFGNFWTNNAVYEPGTLVLHGGNVYLCLVSHTSSSYFGSDILNWEVFATGTNFVGEWRPNYAKYRVGDVVRYGGFVYQCILEHTSPTLQEGIGEVSNLDSTVLNEDSTAEIWETLVESTEYKGNYTPNTLYKAGDQVKLSGSIYRCIEEHTSPSITGQVIEGNWKVEFYGFKFKGAWRNDSYYAVGDVVRQTLTTSNNELRGGTLWMAVRNNFNVEPSVLTTFTQTSIDPQTGNVTTTTVERVDWVKVSESTNFIGEFDPDAIITEYLNQGDLIRRGSSLWISIRDQQSVDDSTLVVLDDDYYELVIPSMGAKGAWEEGTFYHYNDVVYYRGSTYFANTPHISSTSNFPGDNGEGIELWTLVIQGQADAGLEQPGDLLTYNLSRSIVNDGSTLGPTRVPIGNEDEVLYVSDNEGTLGYKVWGSINRIFYVATTGVDDATDPARGDSFFKPYRTIRFALEQADDGYSGHTTIKVYTGEYEEILPLILPVRTAIVGEELRSVTIRPNAPIAALANDAQYTLAALIRLGLIIDDIILGVPITPSVGNDVDQAIGPLGDSASVTAADGLIGNIISYIEYRVNGIGTAPAVTGSNTASVVSTRLASRQAIENNRAFLVQELISYVESTYPLITFDTEKCRRDINKFIDAILYDLLYSGNYKSILAARFYSNAVVGSEDEDMFYVRDATGIRNVTLKGLEGTLPAPLAGENYQIPTGGAYVSLDPGWGPDDQQVWITTRSCYVQNVTTFGTGAIGQKIDGLLHNGGNKSIVSNDFTQVISDGIGAWVTNGGRAELVSVFTYYAHIGMFAKDGGIIRATNGNSSYGDFGAVADGIDPNETVRYGKLNTRTEQAQVDAAFAGEINDYILLLEFRNAGQSYTDASYSITSSGYGAVVQQEEFRDNAVFETQVLSQGNEYLFTGNQAQGGNTLQITLASNEGVLESQILGMRIIIISGEGTGQYGYVHSYNSGTKVCIVKRESDDQFGWDHVVPGTPSSNLLTTGTRYRFEPRPIFSNPEYTASQENLNVSTPGWSAAVYGETNGVFPSIQGALGTGTTIEVVPEAARFTVTKTGRTYQVALADPGAGYSVGDTITIDGTSVGGISIENDIVITVAATTEDSTNSISTFEITNAAIADSGKFVLMPNSGNQFAYSANGVEWTLANLPNAGEWKCLAAGNNKFVAIAKNSTNAVVSSNGVDWASVTMPATRDWNSVVYGKPVDSSLGVYVAVAGNLNAGAFSTDGTTWTSTTLPPNDDSTLSEWVDITFGKNKFVALANNDNSVAIGTYNSTTNTISWEHAIMDSVADSTQKNWISIAYGNQRFVAISSTGDVSYSFDGYTWLPGSMPTQDGSTKHNWKQIRYGQGVFFAIGDTGYAVVGGDPTSGPTTFAATSYDGIVWTPRELASSLEWNVVAFGNPDVTLGDSSVTNNKPTWIAAPGTASSYVNRIFTGARALGRVVVDGQGISRVKMWEPGSGYVTPPTLSIVDPNNTIDAVFRTRIADGVLAQPTFINRGQSYKTSTTFVQVSGNGFADITPVGRFITIDGLSVMPGPGAQFYIGGRTDYFTAVVVDLNTEVLPDGTLRSTFQISPRPTLADNFEDDMEVLIREKYSQVRITGHDFLDVGTGNFEETNYPVLYADYEYNADPLQEVQNLNGGRVFYTSTDQDGNFRAGELFAVEQATGIITISADFFDLEGLTELRLGGVRVGSTAIIREFSKDGLFLQNSNNIIPTQRAIRSYLQSRLNIGGEDLLTPSVIAGTVQVGPNLIDNTANLTIDIPVIADFSGDGAAISGSILAQTMFFRSFKDD